LQYYLNEFIIDCNHNLAENAKVISLIWSSLQMVFYFLKVCDALGKCGMGMIKPSVNGMGMEIGKVIFCEPLQCAA
jgi:hypothetical protein